MLKSILNAVVGENVKYVPILPRLRALVHI